MVTDDKGEKMSKVKGNTIDPVDVIAKHGADPLRFALAWLTTHASQGKNIKFSMGNVEDARRFANKIWNATRFALLNLEGFDADRFADRTADGPDRAEFDLPERWILSRVQRASEEVDKALEEYRISDAAQAVYHFIWDEICDWYIEFAKGRLGNKEDPNRWKVQGTLVTALETAMRLLHPFMPFITEELWERMADHATPRRSMLMTSPWPDLKDLPAHEDARAEMNWLIDLVANVRSVRAEMNVPPGARIALTLKDANTETQERLARHRDVAMTLARLSSARVSSEIPKGSAQFVLGEAVAALPLGDVIDFDKERVRLAKELKKAEDEIARFDSKLSNAAFIAKAPEEVIDEQKEKRAEAAAMAARLGEALKRLSG
jgi:valyl-tRNA synthetase